MKRIIKKLSAVLLCLMVAATMTPATGFAADGDAGENTTVVETEATTDAAEKTADEASDFAKMSVEEQYEYVMSLEDDKAVEEALSELTEEQQAALVAYAQEKAQAENSENAESTIPAVNFTNVAPFLDPVEGVKTSTYARSNARSFSLTAQNDEEPSSSGMEISKTATANEDGSYTIQLEAYATGEKIISEVTEDVATDIVLVLDQSGSMADSFAGAYTKVYGSDIDKSSTYYVEGIFGYYEVSWCSACSGWYGNSHNYIGHWPYSEAIPMDSENDTANSHTQFYVRNASSSTKLAALKKAVGDFASNVTQKSLGKDGVAGTEDDVNHRIAVVGFASGDSFNGQNQNYSNTEVFVGSTQYKYGAAARGVYGSAFQSMNTTQGQTNVNNSIANLDAEGGTLINLGMEMANGILDANPVAYEEKRNRVVIVFTDGTPGWSGYESTTANAAISQGTTAKESGASVYTVGIFSGADATSAGKQNGSDAEKANWFMQNLSSNNGTPQDPSYYLSAADSDALKNIFKQISQQIETGGSSTTLSEKTVIKDIVSPQFMLPDGATAANITLETYACTGKDGESYTWSNNNNNMGATATVDGSNVSVTGFNFAENYVGTVTENGNVKYRGNKLVISFTVKPKAGFLGGNNVYTNDSAGVYENSSAESPVLTFERPTVDVPIDDVTVTATNKNVYLLGGVTAAELQNGATVKVGDVELNLGEENYGLAEWQNEYVDIVVGVTDNNGKAITDLSGLTDDVTYTVTVTVSPKEEKEGTQSKTDRGEGNINVYKPVITYSDVNAYYGDEMPDNIGNVKWMHLNSEANQMTMGEAPELEQVLASVETNNVVNEKINTKKDFYIASTINIVTRDVDGTVLGRQDISDYVDFEHNACDPECAYDASQGEFVVHVNTCQLTINKSGGKAGEPYVVTVSKDGNKYTELTIVGNGSATIYELPVGTYTITEDSGWSWRYNATSGGPVTLSKSNTSASIDITNTANEKIYWLNGYSTVVRNMYGDWADKVTE